MKILSLKDRVLLAQQFPPQIHFIYIQELELQNSSEHFFLGKTQGNINGMKYSPTAAMVSEP